MAEKKITLPWAEVFRTLCGNEDIDGREVIYRFLDYCDKQEEEINAEFAGKR